MWRTIPIVAAALAGLGACIGVGRFECDDERQCGDAHTCEATGYCSFHDPTCDSQRRYSRYAPPDLAMQCVELPSGSTSGDTVADGTGGNDSSGTTAPPMRTDESEVGSSDDGGPVSPCLPEGRAAIEPLLLYDFCEGEGTSVESLTATALQLQFENGDIGSGFAWVDDGLHIDGEATALRSVEPLFERLEPCMDNGEVTLETWITPATESQGGPTVVAAIGRSTEGSGTDLALMMNPEWTVPGWVAAVHTSADASADGQRIEWLGIPFLRATHLVVVHEQGTDTLWIDGEIAATAPHAGDLSVWNPNFDLVLANRPNYDVRNWAGTYHLVAIYCEALSAEAIAADFAAGHRPG